MILRDSQDFIALCFDFVTYRGNRPRFHICIAKMPEDHQPGETDLHIFRWHGMFARIIPCYDNEMTGHRRNG